MDVVAEWTTKYLSYPDVRQSYAGHALPSTVLINGTTLDTGRGDEAGAPSGGADGAERLPGLPFLRQESWTVPLLAASATNAAAILAFEVYIIARAMHGTPSRRHLFLGQCLLLGLLLCSLSGLPLALEPSAISCAAVRLSTTISPALVFGTLLVKSVFLISLNSGVYLPAHYQALLLFFVVLVQVSISIQWLASAPASVLAYTTEGEGGRAAALCSAPYRHLLLALFYVMMLMLAVTVLAIKCRGFRENYRESSYIGASIGFCLPLWVSWTLAGLMLPERLQPACVGFGIVITASIVFLVMFLPKGRQLAAVGKDGIYREDRDDRLSTVSAARYSPSFFLFKPIKPTKEIQRQSNSFYKSPPSGMFGYGVLPPHNPPLFPHHPTSGSPFSAPSFKAVHRSTPQPIYSGLRHKTSIYTSLQTPVTSSTYQTPPYSVLRYKTYNTPATLQDRRRPRRSKATQPVLRQCTPIYWPQIHANGHGLFHKGTIAKTPGEPVYLARYLH